MSAFWNCDVTLFSLFERGKKFTFLKKTGFATFWPSRCWGQERRYFSCCKYKNKMPPQNDIVHDILNLWATNFRFVTCFGGFHQPFLHFQSRRAGRWSWEWQSLNLIIAWSHPEVYSSGKNELILNKCKSLLLSLLALHGLCQKVLSMHDIQLGRLPPKNSVQNMQSCLWACSTSCSTQE